MTKVNAAFLTALPDGVTDVSLAVYAGHVIVNTNMGTFTLCNGMLVRPAHPKTTESIFRNGS